MSIWLFENVACHICRIILYLCSVKSGIEFDSFIVIVLAKTLNKLYVVTELQEFSKKRASIIYSFIK